jgi:hypothetical protein
VVNKIKLTVVRETVNGFFSPNLKCGMNPGPSRVQSERVFGIVCSPGDSKDFCGDGSHFASLSTSDFAGDATRLQRFRHTERRQRRERFLVRTFAPVANEVELIRKAAPPRPSP